MSASLVGSEMCIRDRHPVCAARHCALLQDSCEFLAAALPPSAHAPRPVSYTHLTLPTICSV
eukprot:950616-Alexandrium_andersonii.AAC.1